MGEQEYQDRRQAGIEMPEPTLQAPPSLFAGVMARLEQRQRYLQAASTPEEQYASLHHPSWEIRAAAVYALGETGTVTALDLLLQALEDEHRMVRVAALRGLGKLGRTIPLEYLLLAMKDSEWEVREMAILVLGDMKAQRPDLLEPLLKAAQHDPHTHVRDAARHTLGQYERWHKGYRQIAEQVAIYDAHVYNQDGENDSIPATHATVQQVEEIQHPDIIQHHHKNEKHACISWKTLQQKMLRDWQHYRLVGLRQIPLIHKSIWLSAPLAILVGFLFALHSVQSNSNLQNIPLYLALFTTISAAAGAAFICGGENKIGLELTLSTPTSIRMIMFWRFILIVSYNLLLSALASTALALIYAGGLLQIIQFWLGPVMLISSIALMLSFLLGSWVAFIIATVIEASQALAFNVRATLPIPEIVMTTHWQTNPAMIIVALLLLLIALYYAPHQSRLNRL